MAETDAGRGIGGGFWPAPPEGHPMVQLFVEVDDVGARVVMPPQVLPDGDEMAILVDPEGIPFGLWKTGPHPAS